MTEDHRFGQKTIDYTIMDPTGNITALVETETEIALQPALASRIMAEHPEVEQVGYVSFVEDSEKGTAPAIRLRMAGGEFCGNASLSAAALYLLTRDQSKDQSKDQSMGQSKDQSKDQSMGQSKDQSMGQTKDQTKHQSRTHTRDQSKDQIKDQARNQTKESVLEEPARMTIAVSGASEPLDVCLKIKGRDSFYGGLHMPPCDYIKEVELSYGEIRAGLPLVRLPGISHVIIESGSVFFQMLNKREEAEKMARAWCRMMGAEGLGLMFLQKEESSYQLTPLVFIAGSNTLYWENSCASGSTAAAMYLAARLDKAMDVTFREPGGNLRVVTDPLAADTWLYGNIRSLKSYHELVTI